MKDETDGVVIEELVGWKPKVYSYLVDDNSEHKKTKVVNANVVVTISHNKYKDVLLNKKCLRYSMNTIQSKDHRTGTYEINKIFCLALIIKYTSKIMDVGVSSWLLELIIRKKVILIIIHKSCFANHIVLTFFLVRTNFLSSRLF